MFAGKKALLGLFIFVLVGSVGAFWWRRSGPTAQAPVAVPTFEHVFVVVFENTAPAKALEQPFLKKLTQMGAYLGNFHATTHPSLPNYISMIAGDTMGVADDGVYSIEGKTLVDLLEAKGLSWKVYAEDLPESCSRQNKGLYVQKHVPFLSFSNITTNPERCAKIVDAREFDKDLAGPGLPNYAMFIPNQINDAHDKGVEPGDQWLSAKFGPLLADERFMKNTLFILTFDEDNYTNPENQIYVVFYNPEHVQAGAVNNDRLSHYSVLKFIEDNFQLGNLGRNDATAPAIRGIFK